MLTISGKGLRATFVLITALAVSASAQAATINVGSASWSPTDAITSIFIDGFTATAAPDGATLSDAASLGLGVSPVAPAYLKLDDESADIIVFMGSSALGDQASNPNGPGNGNGQENGNSQGNDNCNGDGLHLGHGHCDAIGSDDGQPVPEPTSLVLIGVGLLIGAGRLRRRK